MKGNVIGFDPDTNTGAISGHDGNRYDFATADWRGQRRPRHGDIVDFQPEGQRATQIYVTEAQYVEPGFGEFLFSPHGRISRSQYWLRWVLPLFGVYLVFFLLILSTAGSVISGLFTGLFGLVGLVLFWPSIAIIVKRVHDRDRPWPFILLLFVPLVQIWPAIEIMFLPGTVGSNRFGPDPVVQR
jgi:uncharacterized membrane protein YhaH (DUF805 family)